MCNKKQYFVRVNVTNELPSGQKQIQILATGAEGIRFYTDSKHLCSVDDILQEPLANRLIEEKYKKGVQDADAMLAVLKMVDADCRFCLYAGGKPPCAGESTAFPCAGCQYDCPCNGCRENSKYEWCGAVEALRRLAEMTKK